MGRKVKPRVIPEQNVKLCRTICMCQLVLVLSGVSFVYLTIAFYAPSYRAFNSDMDPDPVMCQTTNFTTKKTNCTWASCNEWCLTSTSGYCPQIFATVRRNASDVIFQNCSHIAVVSCPMVSPSAYKRYNCNNGSECAYLTGMYNCSKGICYQWDDVYLCNHIPSGQKIDAELDNAKMDGFFQCKKSQCTKIKKQFHCDRYCPSIPTRYINIILMQDDTVITGYCKSAVSLTESQGNLDRIETEPTNFWNQTTDKILIANCMTVSKDLNNLKAIDCLNGTIIDSSVLPPIAMNFTQFGRIYRNSSSLLDPTGRYLPDQQTLTIYNHSRLLINLDACVNTLRDECEEFGQQYGRDGRNDTAPARYPCYYHKESSFRALLRFDLERTYRELLVAAIVPSLFFVISCTFLCVVIKSVRVGDDTRMRCKYCGDNNEDQDRSLIGNDNKKESNNDEPNLSQPPTITLTESGTKREIMRTASSNSLYHSDSDVRPENIIKSATAGSRLGGENPLVGDI